MMKQLFLSAPLLSCGLHALAAIAEDAPSYRDKLVTLHQDLIEIPSVTENEADVGNFLIDYLNSQGFVAERQPIPSSNDTHPRFNVIAWPEGRTSNSSRVVLSSHIDTVPPYIGYSRSGPEPPTAETLIAGRGVVDAKGSVATQIIAVQELLAQDLIDSNDVGLAYVVGEEVGGAGMQHYSEVLARQSERPKAVIFGEPTEATLACGHKGIIVCEVSVKGKAAHSGYPELGKSANEVLMRGLVKAIDTDLGSSDRFGNTTISVGLLSGGSVLNVIPESAAASLLIRVGIEPQETGHKIVQQRLEEVLLNVDSEAFITTCPIGYGAISANCDVEGFKTGIMKYATDIPFLKGNHTSYLYGPGSIQVAHTASEVVRLGDLELAVEDYKKLILHAVKDSERR